MKPRRPSTSRLTRKQITKFIPTANPIFGQLKETAVQPNEDENTKVIEKQNNETFRGWNGGEMKAKRAEMGAKLRKTVD